MHLLLAGSLSSPRMTRSFFSSSFTRLAIARRKPYYKTKETQPSATTPRNGPRSGETPPDPPAITTCPPTNRRALTGRALLGASARSRAGVRRSGGGPRRGGGGDQRKGPPLLLSPLSCFAGAARVSRKEFFFRLLVGFYLPAEEKKAARRLSVNLRV